MLIRNDAGKRMTLGEMVVHSMSHWPKTMLDSLPGDLGKLTPSVPNYCRVIALPESWTDFAFLTACADLDTVAIQLVGVTDLSKIVDNFLPSECWLCIRKRKRVKINVSKSFSNSLFSFRCFIYFSIKRALFS